MLRQRIEYSLYLPFKALVRRLSLASARRLGQALGGAAFYVFRRRTRQALANLALVFPEMSIAARRDLARRAARQSGAALVEGLSWSFRDASDAHFDVQGGEHLAALIRAGRPFVAVGAHFGVWELGLVPFEDQLAPITVIAKPATNPYFRGESARFRERRRFQEVSSQGATWALYAALRRGESVGLVVDQRVNPEDGVLVPFLGVPAWTSTTAATLAVRCGAPILPFFVQPAGRDGYRVDYLEPLELSGGPVHQRSLVSSTEPGHREAILELTRRIAAVQEERIRRAPESWFWVHDRWRRIKRYEWDETKARWRLRSRLPERAEATRPGPTHPLDSWLREMERGPSLQRGDQYRLRTTDPRHHRAIVAWAHALIDRGRSVRWVDAEELESASADGSPRALDLFDLVIVALDGAPTGSARRCLEGLATHRSAMCRSSMWVGPRGTYGGLDGVVAVEEASL